MSGFDSAENFIEGIARGERKLRRAGIQACVQYAEQILADSQAICPVSPSDKNHPFYTGHSGALRDSAVVKPAVVTRDKVTVEMGYNTGYDLAVHERIEANHKYPGALNPNASSKYLEKPIRAAVSGFMPFVQSMIREAIDG